MKYDCNKTLDYMHERNRACEEYKDCDKCPLSEICYCEDPNQEMIDTLQKWSDEHQEKTNIKAIRELYPNAREDAFCMAKVLNTKCPHLGKSCKECSEEWCAAPYGGGYV